MEMVEHVVDLHGPRVTDGQRSPEAIGGALSWIEPIVRESVSMAFCFISRKRGRRPGWLSAASNVRFAGISNHDSATRLHFEAPRLGEAAEDLYRQQQLFETRPAEQDTGFDLLGDALSDVLGQRRDSSRFDKTILARCRRVKTMVRMGVTDLIFRGDRLPKDVPVAADLRLADLAGQLELETPKSKRARIAGNLDMIRASDGTFALKLESGEDVYGVWLPDNPETLADLWRKNVVVEGAAVFRASGSLLRVEAEGMALASGTDMFFSRMPEPTPQKVVAEQLREAQTTRTGIGAIFGQWPGDESEEDILAASRRS